ncbi:MAG TPA: type II toxin-antitoxin system VapC family toxin [Candidatus Hydrogenedentes bacterium]|nr:type II toxin-antitoxin system VapC family toxin [Candidatus Hydrogenedentota bacterium]HIJ73232.1 type II toxin-antitoxin system VapC family toxin [Candidatus Hydrogenedentota bacterium]
MIFDTDVLIWTLRGNEKAARAIENDPDRAVSVVSCMELFRGARNKRETTAIRRFLLDFDTIPLSEDIGHRACIYIEQLTLKAGIEVIDALIAATATEHQQKLCTGNTKHYRAIPELELKPFRP